MDFPEGFTPKDRDELLQQLLDAYQTDPERIRKALPQLAERLDSISSPPEQPHIGSGSPSVLSDSERALHAAALDSLLKKSQSSSVTVEEAIQGLEHGAALLMDGFSPNYPTRKELLRLVRKATGIAPRKSGKPVTKTAADGEGNLTVPVVRGIELHLTHYLKLVSVTLDPHQWRLRSQALGFVGITADSAEDVAERHDEYLADAIQYG